eukprot:CAMPEP_0181297226 /NCGR_PEP_ID=MMETSP1101-20121128/5125_1 /TAXON_ID=46948 /ORGANISM="Rhodomonas abbreviata, Strain Caron Lab Isolate" /LENGTH=170 /DNA_ID=CAMNT_0023402145 /DNA_START=74 /DNA_END=583 /DNA_ORIENTATION=-
MGNKSTKQQRFENASKTGVFSLEDKHLTSFPSDALKIEALRMLTIENCGLSKIPSDIAKVSNTLQRAKLARNKLKTLPEAMASLSNLQQLDVKQNQISDLPPILFANMANLKEAYFGQNLLTSFPPSIGSATSLKVLDLSNNKLLSLPPSLSLCASLQDLLLNANALPSL